MSELKHRGTKGLGIRKADKRILIRWKYPFPLKQLEQER